MNDNKLMKRSDQWLNDVEMQANAWSLEICEMIDDFELEMDSGPVAEKMEERYNKLEDVKNAILNLMSSGR